MNTTNIFEAFLRGEPQGVKAIFFTYQFPLKEFARRLVGRDDAVDDAVSEAFKLLWERRGSFQSDIHIQRFLYLAVKLNCLTERRSRWRLFSRLPAGWDRVDPDASELVALKELNAHNQWIIVQITRPCNYC